MLDDWLASNEGLSPRPGRAIRAHRIRLGLSLDQLAGVTKLSPSALSDYENGKRVVPPEALRQIILCLNLSSCDLAGPKPSAYDIGSKLFEIADGFAFAPQSRVDPMRQEFREFALLLDALRQYREFVKEQIRGLPQTSQPTNHIDPDIIRKAEEIFMTPLREMDGPTYPRSFVLHEIGKLRIVLANLAAVERIHRGWEVCFDSARKAFEEALSIKRELTLKPQHVLPTMLKVIEVEIDHAYWGAKKLDGRRYHSGNIVKELTSFQSRLISLREVYQDLRDRSVRRITETEASLGVDENQPNRLEEHSDFRAFEHGNAHCAFVLARVAYQIGKARLEAKELAEASMQFKLAEGLCEEARETKARLNDIDGMLWIDVLLAKCAWRKFEMNPRSQQLLDETVRCYTGVLFGTDLWRLEDLRSLCALTLACKDIDSVQALAIDTKSSVDAHSISEIRRQLAA